MSDNDSDTSEQQQEADLSSSDVVTKYKAAADIANGALDKIVRAVKPGAKLGELCSLGDKSVLDAVGTMFKGKAIEKGLAFPTCISPNSVAGHLSPAADDETTIHDGDVVKIDLAAHIDGFIACVAHTVVVQSEPVKGNTADALAAAHTALEAALRLVRPGKKIADVAGPLNTIVESYGCTLVEGVLSHQLKQFVVDGNKCILNRPNPEAKVEDGEFEENEVYALDILVSTGEGKPKITDEKQTTVYKRALDVEYRLKMAASRQVFSEINKNYPTMPFSTRVLDARNCRLGMVECLNHGLLHPYPVMHERAGAVIVQLKATVLLMPNGSDKVTGLAPQPHESEKSITDDDVKALLATSLKSKKKPKKKSKAGPAWLTPPPPPLGPRSPSFITSHGFATRLAAMRCCSADK
ncbi:hypothetical protein WJX84_003810 [Apatococcus fuscideae]|uniref:Peptidase M24 domain-containing protein n=1 Tax=Apatococcus fuscideae TaxID=2026836 RepID=A0AAW1SS95_9CHLO